MSEEKFVPILVDGQEHPFVYSFCRGVTIYAETYKERDLLVNLTSGFHGNLNNAVRNEYTEFEMPSLGVFCLFDNCDHFLDWNAFVSVLWGIISMMHEEELSVPTVHPLNQLRISWFVISASSELSEMPFEITDQIVECYTEIFGTNEPNHHAFTKTQVARLIDAFMMGDDVQKSYVLMVKEAADMGFDF